MIKIEKDYKAEYGDIPKDSEGRMDYLLSTLPSLSRQKTTVRDVINRIIKIKWKKLNIVVYLLPKATPRPRSGRSGVFYVKGAKDNKIIFEDFIRNQEDINIITTPTKFHCTSYFPIPKSMNPVEKICAELGFIRPTSKPDWDNVAKAYCDMTQGNLLLDDSLIIEGTSKKFYSVKPRIELTIEYMEDYDSVFNKQKILKQQKG